jgi:hypothetical protein
MAADLPTRRWVAPLLVISGLLLAIYGIRILGASYAITRWPVTPARVVRSSVTNATNGRHFPVVHYEFFLAGERYVGAGITRPATPAQPGAPAASEALADSVVARYPVGAEVLAGYDPVNPSRAVLRPRFNWWTLVPVILGVVLGVSSLRLWRAQRPGPPVAELPESRPLS